ncbi:MAG TPA: GTP-binding protein [Candidatus Acidoferrum sp.]|nr:GTP-binding protein [Candidatus Acidoferrum sp.]
MKASEFQPGTAAGSPKPRYIMIGGFLGAGKTTAVGRLAAHLTRQGLRVGLITNDQGRNLVDTTLLRCQGFRTEEIPGGCFCCRFDALVEAARKLAQRSRPDVFIAEPVGSCTDLVATVAYPLRRLHGANLTVAPVSVLVDPVRALRSFGVEPGGTFSDKVLYIYQKQIEEADLIVISKCDLLDERRLASLREAIAATFPRKEILAVSAREGTNLEAWFERITREEQRSGRAMQVDYEVYADGEARLGWSNCTARLAARKKFNGDLFLLELAVQLRNRLCAAKAEIAHLKMTLVPDDGGGKVASINIVRSDVAPEAGARLGVPVTGGQLMINLRAEAAPEVLGTAVREGLQAAATPFDTLVVSLHLLDHFRPGKPTPTHRLAEISA